MLEWNNINLSGYQSNLENLENLPPHEILNIPEDASLHQIKNAYREKMKIYHPDKNQNFTKDYAEEVGKILNNAYQNLVNRIKE